MSEQLQLRGGTAAEHAVFTGAVRELTIETDTSTLIVHDGVTVGGHRVTKDSTTNVIATKVAGIEDHATADQTGAEIKTAYEAEADTNAFTDAEKSKLGVIEAGATADQTASEIVTLYEGTADTNKFTDKDVKDMAAINMNAPKELSALNITAMEYTNNNLSKIVYEGTGNFEILTYDPDGLTNVAHTINNVLKGNTDLNYMNGDLVTVTYTKI